MTRGNKPFDNMSVRLGLRPVPRDQELTYIIVDIALATLLGIALWVITTL